MRSIVGLCFQSIFQIRKTEGITRRRRITGAGVQLEVRIIALRERNLLGERFLRIDEAYLQLGAGSATRRIDGIRATKTTDVETIKSPTGTAVGRFAYHHVILTVIFSSEGAVAILAVQDGVIGKGLLELGLIDNRDVRVKDAVAEAETVDFHGDALAFLHR